jgi:release factor glutamine methyltransferase
MIEIKKAKKQIQAWYKNANILEKSEVDWLFCHALKVDRAKLMITDKITKAKFSKIKKIAKKRVKGMPLAKIIKTSNFYGLDFKVNKCVLTPRKETELLVEKVISDFKDTQNKRMLDLGTGSGAIVITIKKHLPNINVVASDICSKALRVAKHNARVQKVQIGFVKCSLFDKIDSKFDIVASNPPYIKSSDIKNLQTEVKDYDPLISLEGGLTGFNFYKQIIKTAPYKLVNGGKLYLELGKGQSEQVKKMLAKNFTNIEVIKDYNNVERVIVATKKEK